MKRIKRWLVCYLFPLAVLGFLGWLMWQQCLLSKDLANQNDVINQLESQIQALRTPKVIQDENKHYQQMAYLVLVDRSDLDLGSAYLEVLKANYTEIKDRQRAQAMKTLKEQVDALRAQVKNRTQVITDLQSQLSKPGKQKESKPQGWLKPLKNWVHVEYHEGKPGSIDPQQWRYWSTLEQARWYLVHGHYDEYLDAIAQIQSWAKLYPGDMDWADVLVTLSQPLQDLDLSIISHKVNLIQQLKPKNAKPVQNTIPKEDSESLPTESKKTDAKSQPLKHGVIA